METKNQAESVESALLSSALGSRYKVVRLIGRGGAGAVFLCRDTALHRSVAIKVLRSDLSDCPDLRELFLREARLGAQLTDPGTVPVHDIIVESEFLAFIMPYAGVSLGEIVRRDGPLDAIAMCGLLDSTATVLSRLHRRGVLHRDIKPDNVLLDGPIAEARVRLSDFGVALVPLSDRGLTNRLFVGGSPPFMAPEQSLHALEGDQRSDLYALGVLGYFLLTGALPFDGGTISEVLDQQRHSRFVPLRERRGDIAPRLAAVIERCLAADPGRRWASADDFRVALRSPHLSRHRRRLERFLTRMAAGIAPRPALNGL